MSDLRNMLWIESRKVIRSRMPLFTALGLMILPAASAFMMFIYRDPEFARKLGLISAKAELIGGSADWPFYLSMLAQGIAAGGLMVFGMNISWLFGREFADGMVKDMLAAAVAALLTILIITPTAIFASVGRGYLLPIGILILSLIVTNVIAVLGWGEFFPWAIPMLYAQAKEGAAPGLASYIIVLLTALIGMAATGIWWLRADQNR